MRKLTLTLTAAAACTLGLSLAGGAQARVIGADAIRAALDKVRLVEPVHCTPGRVHRRSPPYDGCYRTSRRTYYAPVPYTYYAPSPYPYGYRHYYYGSPGISFGFSTGRRHHGYGFGWGF